MNTRELVQIVERAPERRSTAARRGPLFYSELIGPARQAILCARQFLLSEQREDGSWLGTQIGDASLASQLVFLLTYLERDCSELVQQAAAAILAQQLPSGGWSLLPNGLPDVSTSVQAYFALKLAGFEACDERLVRAREVIREHGGADAADVQARFFLALFGQVDWDCCTPTPPETLLWNAASTQRNVPLALIWSHRPVRDVGIERGVRELFLKKPSDWRKPSLLDRAWQLCERRGWLPLRGRALARAESSLLEQLAAARIEQLDFSELVWHTIALHAIGYPADGSEMLACETRLHEMTCIDDDGDRACPRLRTSPFADTVVALRALRASGLPLEHESVPAGTKCLAQLRRKHSQIGVTELAGVLHLLCSADAVELADEHALPPDLSVARRPRASRNRFDCPGRRGQHLGRVTAALLGRLLDQQRRDGSWENASEITGAVVEAIAAARITDAMPPTDRAIQFLRAAQQGDGGWPTTARGADIGATSAAIRGLSAAGVPNDDDAIAAGVNWLIVHQQAAGGWGESVSQTAWALAALVAAGRASHPAALRAANFLLESQDAAGRWRETQAVLHDTSTGRPFRDALHATAEALAALSHWAVAAGTEHANPSNRFALRLVGTAAES